MKLIHNKIQIILIIFIFSNLVMATDTVVKQKNNNNLFIGIGGGYNAVKSQQEILGIGPTKVYNNSGVQIAYGDASGITMPFTNIQTNFSPEFQIGYLRSLNLYNKEFIGGVKLFYKYLGTTDIERDIDGPQDGSLTNVFTGTTPLVGNFTIEASQLNINHEIDLLAFFGKTIKNNLIYLGAGPTLFETGAKLYKVIGFARVHGVPTDVTGSPANSNVNNKWVWGGIAQLGMIYNLSKTWKIDFNYSYSLSEKYTIYHTSNFTSYTNIGTQTVSTVGTGYVIPTQQITVQAFNITINKFFEL